MSRARAVAGWGMLAMTLTAAAQTRTEYRGFWVDTFNSSLNRQSDIAAVVERARAAKVNMIFAQVRRRGDAWYLNSLEPRPDFVEIEPGFDPLQALIVEAHANGIEVHAFVIMAAVWNKNPTFAPSATLGPPVDPNHVFNLHGGYDPVSRTVVPGPDNWLTRTLLPDVAGSIGFGGHRFGNDFWIDFGHPDAARYTVDVLMHLVRNYNIDGLHLDRIRYPELTAPGQTPATGANIGYNATSVARFQRHYGIPPGSPPPGPGDPLWSQWRRDQVSNVVRRVYLGALEIRPSLKLSAALIAFGGGPVAEADWRNAEAYWRVFQDWRAWTEEGILDIAIPMVYKREHVPAEAVMYNQWLEWTRNHQYGRAGMMGQGVYLNSVEGTLRQARRALMPNASTGRSVWGVNLYAMANPDAAVTANPWSVPVAMKDTPLWPFADFAAGLTTGASADRTTQFENPSDYPTALFAEPALIPSLTWKSTPAKGHLMGFARGVGGHPLDTVAVKIENLSTHALRTVTTDGGGFFGVVDLEPGPYEAAADDGGLFFSARATVKAGSVATADLKASDHRRRSPVSGR